MINGGVNHDHTHPPHQHHFEIFLIPELELFKIAEHFYKAVVDHVHSFIVMVDIAKYSFETIPIILLVEEFLIPLVISYAASYESL